MSIAEGLELVFDSCLVREHVRDAILHRVAATAPIADQLASIGPDFAPVHRTGQQADDPRLQRGRDTIGSSASGFPFLIGELLVVTHAHVPLASPHRSQS
jgi:hypothetical protein